MDRAEYAILYETPNEFLPPKDVDLSVDRSYPSLNTRDYRKREPDRTWKHNRFFEVLTGNDENLVILVTNDLTGRIWNGNFWAYENLNDFSEKTSCFKHHVFTTVTGLTFLNTTKFVVSQLSGTLTLWTTKIDCETPGYSVTSIAEKKEHLGGIICMEVLRPSNKVVTGSNDCFLKIWDCSESDLKCASTLRYAHTNDITSVSTSPTVSDVFVSCSRDKSALIWDYRLPKPAKILYENNAVALSAVKWCNEPQEQERVLLGDDSGYLNEVDPKMPMKIIKTIKVFDRPIRKISKRGPHTAVIGNTNIIRVYDTNFGTKYENSEATDFVRDVYWDSDDSFYTVGWDKAMRHHCLKSHSD